MFFFLNMTISIQKLGSCNASGTNKYLHFLWGFLTSLRNRIKPNYYQYYMHGIVWELDSYHCPTLVNWYWFWDCLQSVTRNTYKRLAKVTTQVEHELWNEVLLYLMTKFQKHDQNALLIGQEMILIILYCTQWQLIESAFKNCGTWSINDRYIFEHFWNAPMYNTNDHWSKVLEGLVWGGDGWLQARGTNLISNLQNYQIIWLYC